MSTIATLEAKVDRLSEKLDRVLLIAGTPDRITSTQIAEELGVSKWTLSHEPWLLPRNGKSPYRKRPREWDRSEWEEWKEIPVEYRESRYWSKKMAESANPAKARERKQ